MHQTPNGLYYDLWALPRPMTRTWGSGSLFKRLCENFGDVDMAFGKTDGIPEGVQYADLENGIDWKDLPYQSNSFNFGYWDPPYDKMYKPEGVEIWRTCRQLAILHPKSRNLTFSGKGGQTMTTPFLTYELLTPETADPVVIRIREQGERFMRREYLSSNGILITTAFGPGYFPGPTKHPELFLRGDDKSRDLLEIEIPLSDWPAVKQAIRELNEYYDTQNTHTTIRSAGVSPAEGCTEAPCCGKEKDLKEDRYEFPASEWEHNVEWETKHTDDCDFHNPTKIVLTRKKPKVKVEWKRIPIGTLIVQDYGYIHLVQFQVTGWTCLVSGRVEGVGNCEQVSLVLRCPRTRYIEAYGEDPPSIYIGSDAKGCWSQPVLLPESVYSRLDEITKALEDRANGGEG